MSDSLLKKVAIITGADTVVGRAVLLRLLEEGAKVAALAERPDSLDDLRDEFPARLILISGSMVDDDTRGSID